MIRNIIISCLYAIVFSFFANIIIDIILVIPSLIIKTKLLELIRDIIFPICFAITHILILYFLNNGSYRWYYMISQIIGGLIYKYSVGKILHIFVYYLIKQINKIKSYYNKFYLSFSIAKSKRKMYNKSKV